MINQLARMAVENFTPLSVLGRRNFERKAMSFVHNTQCSKTRKVTWRFLSYCLIIKRPRIEDNFGSLLLGPKFLGKPLEVWPFRREQYYLCDINIACSDADLQVAVE